MVSGLGLSRGTKVPWPGPGPAVSRFLADTILVPVPRVRSLHPPLFRFSTFLPGTCSPNSASIPYYCPRTSDTPPPTRPRPGSALLIAAPGA